MRVWSSRSLEFVSQFSEHTKPITGLLVSESMWLVAHVRLLSGDAKPVTDLLVSRPSECGSTQDRRSSLETLAFSSMVT